MFKITRYLRKAIMLFWSNSDSKKPHMAFFGRWCPLHKGHVAIIKEKLKQNPDHPVLILIRDTSFDDYSADFRFELVVEWMKSEKIEGTIMVCPDIEGVYWGRGVGYNVSEVEVSEEVKAISATKIRQLIGEGDNSWRELMANESVADFLEKNLI